MVVSLTHTVYDTVKMCLNTAMNTSGNVHRIV